MSSKLNLPPNNCMPSSAKMTMNKKSSSSKLAMERILFSSEATRLRSEFQYLIMGPELYMECHKGGEEQEAACCQSPTDAAHTYYVNSNKNVK